MKRLSLTRVELTLRDSANRRFYGSAESNHGEVVIDFQTPKDTAAAEAHEVGLLDNKWKIKLT